ncbi:MAG: tetrahydrofolate dehydrogenase/cyclohydrolase catalytic domain-containing protein [Candidatus Thermoplasmatota archaeon]|jgi:methylenetetrahydrofolate dehydrogenase (NADP+)/methenyltetrahydrofolate cyclohydrolase|nr:tetrahydrofolate dehydrogenase/cyclohydrolase catalytic domain-containing protein [Candidatus Thermoplasmatota archaeon]
MTAEIISGRVIGNQIREELTAEVTKLKEEHNITPGLAVVLVGEDPASVSYVTAKGRACESAGVFEETIRLPADTPEQEILDLVEKLNDDDRFHGILVQLPLPKHVNEEKVLLKIDPDKDVDGFHPMNVGRMVVGKPTFLPCTPHGIQELLMRSGNGPEGKHVVIVGRSNIVGKPMMNILVQKAVGANATVSVCHTRTKDMAAITRQADIIIVAAGVPEMITADMVSDGVVVIDVGVNRVGMKPSIKTPGKMVADLRGDVDFEGVKEKASFITPVPGGVGPMTITMLLKNTVESAKKTIQ